MYLLAFASGMVAGAPAHPRRPPAGRGHERASATWCSTACSAWCWADASATSCSIASARSSTIRLMMFKVWEGGMSFHGGLLGVMAAALWWSRRQKIHFFDTMDFVAPLVPAGLGFGRIGNFIGGELWGKYTQAGWGVIFPQRRSERAQARHERRRSCRPQYASRRAGSIRAASLAAVPGVPGRPGDVLRAVVVLAQAASALCGVGNVRAALRRVPFPGGIRARAGRKASAILPSAG